MIKNETTLFCNLLKKISVQMFVECVYKKENEIELVIIECI